MVAPSGFLSPKVSAQTYLGFIVSYDLARKSWQKAPYDIPMAYQRWIGIYDPGAPGTLGGPAHDAQSICGAYTSDSVISQGFNQAYESFRNELYSKVQAGVDLVEYRQSLKMIATRATQLYKVVKDIKKLRFGEAAKTLRMATLPKGVTARRSMSNNFLELHFGWEPLVKDIYDGLEVLINPLNKYSKAVGRSSLSTAGSTVDVTADSVDSVLGHRVDYKFWQGASIKLSASYLDGLDHTLDQFGLNNPLSILWETVPFSFVVDWFANVGQVLDSLTDFAGLTLERPWNSYRSLTIEQGKHSPHEGFSGTPRTFGGFGSIFIRGAGLRNPVFQIKQLKLPSTTRAATAISLLNQGLSEPEYARAPNPYKKTGLSVGRKLRASQWYG